ncbi:MAG: hypothetical protein U1F34_07090 [Gammaproteobacteria bacterium]
MRVKTGASIIGSGAVTGTSEEQIDAVGDGAVLRVAAGPQLTVNRSGVSG